MKQEKSRNIYVEPRHDGKPYRSSKDIASQLFAALEARAGQLAGVEGRPGKGRKKLKVTITVEEVA